MAEKHLIEAIVQRFEAMPTNRRVAKIRKLANQSYADGKFIRERFPELYHEAFPPSFSAGEQWESNRPHELCAKPR